MQVSVIMGAYNVEATISKALDSIINQTYPNWNLIVCDDGSSDNTLRILKKYESEYPNKIKVLVNEKNRGLTYTLNHCLKYADGDLIARMDADDISLPHRFEEEVSFLVQHPDYAFVGCAVERFDESGVWKRCSVIEKPDKNVFYSSTGFTHPTIMIRKSALDSVNGYKEIWYTNRCEDYDLWMRLYANGYKGYNLSTILFQYYEGKDSFPKRKYRYRFCEAVMRAKGYARLKMYPKGVVFIFKPLLAGLVPGRLIKYLHKR